MSVPKAKHIANHGHHCWGVCIGLATGVPANILWWGVGEAAKIKLQCQLKRRGQSKFTGSSGAHELWILNSAHGCPILYRAILPWLKGTHHEVGSGKVLKNHSPKTGGCLQVFHETCKCTMYINKHMLASENCTYFGRSWFRKTSFLRLEN